MNKYINSKKMISYMKIIKEVLDEPIISESKKRKLNECEENTYQSEKDILSDKIFEVIIKNDNFLVIDLTDKDLSVHRQIVSNEQISLMNKTRDNLKNIKEESEKKQKEIEFYVTDLLHPENKKKIFIELIDDGWIVKYEEEYGYYRRPDYCWYDGYVIDNNRRHKMKKKTEPNLIKENTFQFQTERDILSDKICLAIIKGEKTYTIDCMDKDLTIHRFIVSIEQRSMMKKIREIIIDNIKQAIRRKQTNIKFCLEPLLHSENKKKLFEELINDGWELNYKVGNNWYSGYTDDNKFLVYNMTRESGRPIY